MTAYRNFGGLEPFQAIAKYKERRETDAQAPVGATEFDDSGEEDQDIGEFDGGALYSQQQLNEQRRRMGEAGETLREINELERGWDGVRGDAPWSPAMFRTAGADGLYASANQQMYNAQSELRRMERANELHDRATPADIDAASTMMQLGRGVPEGFHRMPDGTIMAGSDHLVGDGYLIV